MRKLVGTLTIFVLIIVGVGLYRGWFGVGAEDQPGRTNIEITVDKEKIKSDVEAASKKASQLADKSNSSEQATTGQAEAEPTVIE